MWSGGLRCPVSPVDLVEARLSLALPDGLALQGEAVGVVDEAVEDGVGERRVADGVVPALDRELAGHDRRLTAVAILEDLDEVVAMSVGERLQTPVVQNPDLLTYPA